MHWFPTEQGNRKPEKRSKYFQDFSSDCPSNYAAGASLSPSFGVIADESPILG
jgi:hypothetical protein